MCVFRAAMYFLPLTAAAFISTAHALEISLETMPKTAKAVSIWGVAEGGDVVAAVGLQGTLFVKSSTEPWTYRPVDSKISLFAVYVDRQGVITAVGGKLPSKSRPTE